MRTFGRLTTILSLAAALELSLAGCLLDDQQAPEPNNGGWSWAQIDEKIIPSFDDWVAKNDYKLSPEEATELAEKGSVLGVVPKSDLPVRHGNGLIEMTPSAYERLNAAKALPEMERFLIELEEGLYMPDSKRHRKLAEKLTGSHSIAFMPDPVPIGLDGGTPPEPEVCEIECQQIVTTTHGIGSDQSADGETVGSDDKCYVKKMNTNSTGATASTWSGQRDVALSILCGEVAGTCEPDTYYSFSVTGNVNAHSKGTTVTAMITDWNSDMVAAHADPLVSIDEEHQDDACGPTGKHQFNHPVDLQWGVKAQSSKSSNAWGIEGSANVTASGEAPLTGSSMKAPSGDAKADATGHAEFALSYTSAKESGKAGSPTHVVNLYSNSTNLHAMGKRLMPVPATDEDDGGVAQILVCMSWSAKALASAKCSASYDKESTWWSDSVKAYSFGYVKAAYSAHPAGNVPCTSLSTQPCKVTMGAASTP